MAAKKKQAGAGPGNRAGHGGALKTEGGRRRGNPPFYDGVMHLGRVKMRG